MTYINQIESVLDGNKTLEILEWCESNLPASYWHMQQLSQVCVSRNSPQLLHVRWSFQSDVEYSQFKQHWPCVYQIVMVYYDSGDGRDGQVWNSDTWDTPDAWEDWATEIEMPFETQRVQSLGPYVGTMGDRLSGRFDVRFLRFASKADASYFLLTWMHT